MFWVISVYFNIRNTLPKSGTFLLGHLYVYIHIYYLMLNSGSLESFSVDGKGGSVEWQKTDGLL